MAGAGSRDDVDASRFPTVAAYLAKVPGGLRGYPGCKAKGSLIRSMLAEHPLRRIEGALPPEIVAMVESPPQSTDWISQVHARVVLRAVYDDRFAGDEARFRDWALLLQRRLFSGPLYKILFWGLGAERLVRAAPNRFSHFHVGVTLELESIEAKAASCVLRFPAHVLDPFDGTATSAGMQAALEISGAAAVRAEAVGATPTSLKMAFSWM